MHLRFFDLGKSYNGKTVFNNIRGEINGADKIGLVGFNGIGKTTLVRLLTGREAYDTGKIEYSPNQLKILYIEQNPLFDPQKSVYETIFNAALNSNNKAKDIQTIAKKSLNIIGLSEEKWPQKVITLSGGEKLNWSWAGF